VFKNLLTSAVPNLDHPLEHVLIVLGTAWLSAGLLRDLLAAREEERIVSPAALARTRATLTLGATELAVALGILNAFSSPSCSSSSATSSAAMVSSSPALT
jgi:hypothetical protein